MYVKVFRENGAPLLVNLDATTRRFEANNAEVLLITEGGSTVQTRCACCERRLVVTQHDAEVIPDDAAAWLKGGRGH